MSPQGHRSPGWTSPVLKLLYDGWSLAPETATEEVPQTISLTQGWHFLNCCAAGKWVRTSVGPGSSEPEGGTSRRVQRS